MRGRVDEAVATLRTTLQKDPHNAPAYLLLCRAYLSEEATEEAIGACQAAVSSAPNNSETQDWFGRALGQKAEHAGPLAGYSLAKKVRDAFEAAVRLDPRNPEAFDDLAEFYVEAPGLVGGGLDKANTLAAQASSTLPDRAELLRASIAERSKDYGTAEREFRNVAEQTNRPDAWMDLGRYYARRHESTQAVAAIKHGMELDKAEDASLAHGAEALIKLKMDLPFAADALRSYVNGTALSDSAPACKVYTELGKLLATSGDKAGARVEFEKALSLASGYAPARKELGSL